MSRADYRTVSRKLFHAYDMRIDASLLDREALDRLFDALSVYACDLLKVDSILVCRDARLSGPSIMQTAIERFSCNGFTVYTELHPISTCQFYSSCMDLGPVMGVMIGASHNPGRYTGLKVVGPNNTPIAQDIGVDGGLASIQNMFIQGKAPQDTNKVGRIFCHDGRGSYIENSIHLSGMKTGALSSLRIVVDMLNGSAGTEIMLALQSLGATVVPRNMVPDGAFPLGPPNPIIHSSVAPTLDYLTANPDYDFCFCFDGDGDRMDVIARGGVAVEPSLVMAFIAPTLKNLYPAGAMKGVGFDPKANPQIVSTVDALGMFSQLIANGHSKIKHLLSEMTEEGLFSAVEESAHYYISLLHQSRYIPTENTLLICLLFLKTWMEEKQRFQNLLALQNQSYRRREWGYVYGDEGSKQSALQSVESMFLQQGFSVTKTLPDGRELGSTLLNFSSDTHWARIAQRSSESEVGIARWSVIASDEALLQDIVKTIEKIASAKALSAY